MRGVINSATVGHLAKQPAARLELRLLGPVELRRDRALVEAADWRRERVRSLLTYLALHGPVGRARLAEELWPRLDPVAQSRNLRVTLTYLLRVLEPLRGPRDASYYVRQHGANLSLHAGERLTVDVWEFDRECARVLDADRRGAPAVALDHALRAAALWRAEPTELAEPWAILPVEHRRCRLAEIVGRAGELLLARGDASTALALAEWALQGDPWMDAAHRLAVAAHRGNHDELGARRALGRYDETVRAVCYGRGEATCMVEQPFDGA